METTVSLNETIQRTQCANKQSLNYYYDKTIFPESNGQP